MLSLVLLVLGCAGYNKQPGLLEAVGALPRPPSDVTIMSFNIRYGTASDGEDSWPRRRGMLIETIAAQAPDIIGTQEGLRFQLDEIRAGLPEYAETGVARDDGKQAGEYSAILFRRDRFNAVEGGTFWLSDTPDAPGSHTWGNQLPRICTWVRLRERAAAGGSGRTLYVFNVHLDHQSEDSRRKSVELVATRILARAHPDEPVIFTGDFNCGEGSAAIRFIRGETAGAVDGGGGVPGWTGMTETFRTVHADAPEVGTFHAFRGRSTGEKIDYIFVKAGSRSAVEVIAADIDRSSQRGRWPSDHFPVVATVRLSN